MSDEKTMTIEERIEALDEADAKDREAIAKRNEALRRRGKKKADLLREKELADLRAALDRAREWMTATSFSRQVNGQLVTQSAMDWYQLDRREQAPVEHGE